jgi:hypothetical protein
MTFRARMRIVCLAVLLAIAAPCAGPPVGEPPPQPAAQAQIERLVTTIAGANKGGPGEGIPAMAEQLQLLMDNDREALLLQIVLYLAPGRGNERAMGAALLIDYFSFTSEEKIAALVPHLDTDDGELRAVMWDVLSTVDRPEGGRPNFGHYETVLSRSDTAPAGLIRYMYEVSPIDALSAAARAYGRGDAPATAVQRAQVLEELRARQEPGGIVDLERAHREIDALSRDADWWVRLYIAHVLRARPDLGSPEIVERLRTDAHELVRDTAGA